MGLDERFYDLIDVLSVIYTMVVPMVIGLLLVLGYWQLAKSSPLSAIGILLFIVLGSNILRR